MTRSGKFCPLLLLLVVGISLSVAAKTQYTNYRLVRVWFDSPDQADLLESWEQERGLDVWFIEKLELKYADILMSPKTYMKFLPTFEANGLRVKVIHENIQDLIDLEAKQLAKSKANRANIINKFASFSEINSFLEEVAVNNPSLAKIYQIGNKTLEGRALSVINLKSETSVEPVWIDCGIHAREWVAPATCVYIIDTLINEFNTQPGQSLLAKYDFHICPVVNPDGYEFSRTDTRLWRKNRRPNAGSTCIGVDLNRNYDNQWDSASASKDPCSEVFGGPSAASEPETRAIVDGLSRNQGKWKAFFTLHSYGQWWLTPYGYTQTRVSDYDELERVGNIGAAALAAETPDKTKFVVGSSAEKLYLSSGSSRDFAKDVAKIKYTYTLELRPGQGSADAFYGFLLPEDRLPKVTKETYAGIKAALNAMI